MSTTPLVKTADHDAKIREAQARRAKPQKRSAEQRAEGAIDLTRSSVNKENKLRRRGATQQKERGEQ